MSWFFRITTLVINVMLFLDKGVYFVSTFFIPTRAIEAGTVNWIMLSFSINFYYCWAAFMYIFLFIFAAGFTESPLCAWHRLWSPARIACAYFVCVLFPSLDDGSFSRRLQKKYVWNTERGPLTLKRVAAARY